jgi:hypothetical protein
MRLNPYQARALVTFADNKRLFGPLGAGSGKTLMFFLLGRVANVKTTLLLVPAKLRTKTVDEYLEYAEHWRLPRLVGTSTTQDECNLYVQSYESLGHVQYAAFLDELNPDLLLADEAHALARPQAGRTKRAMRYIKRRKESAGTFYFVPASGTFSRRKIRECAHLADAALGEMSPYPRTWEAVDAWDAATAEGIAAENRLAPGALERFVPEGLPPTLENIRRALAERMVRTPGVVASTTASCDIPLVIQRLSPQVPDAIRIAIEALNREYLLPDGSDVGDPLQKWSAERQISAGFFYRPDPPPPKEWAAARSDWSRFVRETLENQRLLLDTPLQVWNAVRDGQFGHVPQYEKWRDIRDTFELVTKPVWISRFLVEEAEKWAIENNGIVWCSHTALGAEVATDSNEPDWGFKKIPYFGGGEGARLRAHRGPCAASIASHGTGLNLVQFRKALIMTLPSSGSTIEQLLARHHREGQKADVVEWYWYGHTEALRKAMDQAIKDARRAQDQFGNPQRLLMADHLDENEHKLHM